MFTTVAKSLNGLPPFLLLQAFALTFSSCSEEKEISSYEISPEYDGPVVAWKLPENWGENPDLSGPMAGSFHIKTELGPSGRIGVMPFREAVSTREVVNMFGRELGYENFDQNSLELILQTKTIGNKSFEWIPLTDQTDPAESRMVLLALLRKEQETWLFPFIADSPLITQEMNNFKKFLKSVVVRAGKVPIRARNPAALPSPPPAQSANGPTWEAPTHWIQGKPSSMRIGSFYVRDENGNELDFSITSFPGDVGGVLANVNRWLSQVGLDKVDESGLASYLSTVEIDGKSAQLLIAENDDKSLYAALLFRDDRSWFFKIMGESSLAKIEKKNFLGFLDTVCFHDH
ncbi:MAG: hypothetical protein CMI27_01130 [Opitutae bacterium]|nr:hypothetical protein [Opitutae bacterium]